MCPSGITHPLQPCMKGKGRYAFRPGPVWTVTRVAIHGAAPRWLSGKESACSAGDLGSIPGLERSPGEGKGYPLQYSGLENSMDCIVQGVAKSQTRLSDFHFHFRPGGSVVKNLPATAGDSGLIPGQDDALEKG